MIQNENPTVRACHLCGETRGPWRFVELPAPAGAAARTGWECLAHSPEMGERGVAPAALTDKETP